MIVVLPDAGDGDCIEALPCVKALSEREPVYLVCRNPRVAPLIPWSDRVRIPGDSPRGQQHVEPLSIVYAAREFGHNEHPARLYFKQAGLPMPEGVPQPEVRIDGEAGAYDFLVAPWSHEPSRSLTNEEAYALIQRLANEYPGASFVIVGSGESPQCHVPGVNLTEFYGQRYATVGRMMQLARRAVITVDSGPNRLAHAVGIDHHVLLCADVVPEVWGGHPKVKMLYGRRNWTAENVIGKVGG